MERGDGLLLWRLDVIAGQEGNIVVVTQRPKVIAGKCGIVVVASRGGFRERD